MEFEEPFHYAIEPSNFYEFHECNLEALLPFHNDSSISPTTFKYEISNHDIDMERLLQIESDLMDFDHIDQVTSFGNNQINEEAREKELNSLNLQEKKEDSVETNNLIDLLLTGAEAVQGENCALASNVIARLYSLLDHENGDKPFTRLAMFFTRGLHYKSIGTQAIIQDSIFKHSSDSLCAFQMLQEVSPYSKFAHFTANQAILEATISDKEVHIIDFNVMEGIQWPPLMIDLATRKDASLKITTVIDEHQNSSIENTGRRLKEFADSINLPFTFEQMVMVSEDDFENIEVAGALIGNCMTHQLHMPHKSLSKLKTFLGGMTKLAPKIVVLVEEELFNFSKISSMSFVEFFSEAIHHYTALSESLANGFCRAHKFALKVIEKEFLGMRIMDSVRHFPCERRERDVYGSQAPQVTSPLWNDVQALKGYRLIPMSSCNVSQARYLVSLYSGGYWVQNEGCRLALCWKSRPLTIASIWVPKTS